MSGLDDFLSAFSKPRPPLEPKKIKPKRSVEQDIEELKEIFNRVGGDPERYVRECIDFLNSRYELYDYSSVSISATHVSSDLRQKRFGKYQVFDRYTSSPNVYNNIYPYQFRDQQEEGELTLFTYVIDSSGLHLGHYQNMFEIGTGHSFLLPRNQNENYYDIIAAGEVLLQDNSLLFNFESGTFMRDAGLNRFPRYKEFLIDIVGLILSRAPIGREFSSVTFTEDALFPKGDFPLVGTLQRQLRESPTTMVLVDDEKYDIRDELYFTDVAGAQRYFSRHPYQQVMIHQFQRVYTNPYKSQPTVFVDIEQLYTGKRRRRA